MRYIVVIEGDPGSYSAYCPDLPGCVAAAPTLDEVKRLMEEAIKLHLEDMRARGEPLPQPSDATWVDVPVA